mgnify:CR=1 FL=1
MNSKDLRENLELELVECDIVGGGVEKVLVVSNDDREVMSIFVESEDVVRVFFGDLEKVVKIC